MAKEFRSLTNLQQRRSVADGPTDRSVCTDTR